MRISDWSSDVCSSDLQETDPATELAIVIEQARAAAAGEVAPDAALKRRFIQALARMICDAMHPESGDPAFQAIVLRHRSIQVREYARSEERRVGKEWIRSGRFRGAPYK